MLHSLFLIFCPKKTSLLSYFLLLFIFTFVQVTNENVIKKNLSSDSSITIDLKNLPRGFYSF